MNTTSDNILYAVLAVAALLVILSFYRLNRDCEQFNLLDLLLENGRVSRIAFAFMLTLFVTSWIIIKLTIDGKMSEGYLVSYGGLWIAPILTKMFSTNTVSSATQSSSTTIVTQTPEAEK